MFVALCRRSKQQDYYYSFHLLWRSFYLGDEVLRVAAPGKYHEPAGEVKTDAFATQGDFIELFQDIFFAGLHGEIEGLGNRTYALESTEGFEAELAFVGLENKAFLADPQYPTGHFAFLVASKVEDGEGAQGQDYSDNQDAFQDLHHGFQFYVAKDTPGKSFFELFVVRRGSDPHNSQPTTQAKQS